LLRLAFIKEIEMSGWPDPEKPGVPLESERTAWHWVRLPTGEVYALWWRVEAASQPLWAYGTRGIPAPAFASTGIEYLGICLMPVEVEAKVAAEREACAVIADAGAPTLNWQDYHSEVAALRAEGQEAAAEAIAAAIRARRSGA
jgi:hypothetical protein